MYASIYVSKDYVYVYVYVYVYGRRVMYASIYVSKDYVCVCVCTRHLHSYADVEHMSCMLVIVSKNVCVYVYMGVHVCVCVRDTYIRTQMWNTCHVCW